MTTAELHERAFIIDGHNDTLVLKLSRGETPDFGPPNDRYHVDLPRLLRSQVTGLLSYVGARDLKVSCELWEALHWHVETYPEQMLLARTAADLHEAKQTGRVALIGQLESCACLQQSLRVLALQVHLGLRVANLTHGEGQADHEHSLQLDRSEFDYTDSATRERARHELRGLSDFGREFIPVANELGLVIDLAHANDRTFYEALELTTAPPIFSHGCVFSCCPHWRGLTDDQIRRLAERGGVMGVAFYRNFIHPEDPTLERLIDQVEHVTNLVGPDHVGFGADYDGLPEGSIPIPPHVGVLSEFTGGLQARGFDDDTILKVLGGNFLRVFSQVWPA